MAATSDATITPTEAEVAEFRRFIADSGCVEGCLKAMIGLVESADGSDPPSRTADDFFAQHFGSHRVPSDTRGQIVRGSHDDVEEIISANEALKERLADLTQQLADAKKALAEAIPVATLMITGIAATGVPDADHSDHSASTSDPYVRVTARDEDPDFEIIEPALSSVVENAIDPSWDDVLELQLPAGLCRSTTFVCIEIFDRDQGKDDELVATGEVRLPEANAGKLTAMLTVDNKHRKRSAPEGSTVEVTFSYTVAPHTAGAGDPSDQRRRM
mmetsp:Transcript_39535/g.115448  ORF Transcript_39535/g.115448 Transcript_39535/m.115448 type:complete len:273 (+) Transcript_39535:41-859(+)